MLGLCLLFFLFFFPIYIPTQSPPPPPLPPRAPRRQRRRWPKAVQPAPPQALWTAPGPTATLAVAQGGAGGLPPRPLGGLLPKGWAACRRHGWRKGAQPQGPGRLVCTCIHLYKYIHVYIYKWHRTKFSRNQMIIKWASSKLFGPFDYHSILLFCPVHIYVCVYIYIYIYIY